jgi:Uma2 family endonuclease
VVLNERIPPDGIPHAYCPFPADLVVEVVSSGDTASEVADKVEDWLRFGTRLVWVVYPAAPRLVLHRADGTARTLGADDEVDGGDVLPELRMKLRDLLHPFQR